MPLVATLIGTNAYIWAHQRSVYGYVELAGMR